MNLNIFFVNSLWFAQTYCETFHNWHKHTVNSYYNWQKLIKINIHLYS